MSSAAPSLHDAYRDWLGVPAEKIPPDHYTLLGLAPFERDAAKIQQATLERTKKVRPRCLKYHELGTQLLNEIATASVCLTDSKAKAEYDRALQSGGITAALELARKAGPTNQTKLREILQAADEGDLAVPKSAPKPASSKPLPQAKPLDDDEYAAEMALADEEPILATAVPSSPAAPMPARAVAPAGENPFGPPKINDLTENIQAFLLAGGLIVLAGIALVIFIAWRATVDPEKSELAEAAPTGYSSPTGVPPAIGPGQPISQPDMLPPTVPAAAAELPQPAPSSGPAPSPVAFPPPPPMPSPSAPPPPPVVVSSAPPMPAKAAPVEAFIGRIAEIQCRPDHVRIVLTADQVAAALRPDHSIFGGKIEVLAREPGFEEKIIDYRSMLEGMDEFVASGRAREVYSAGLADVGSSAFLDANNLGDVVEVRGQRYDSATVSVSDGTCEFVVHLQGIECLKDLNSTAEVGQPRFSSTLRSDVLLSRLPVDRLLRAPQAKHVVVTLVGSFVMGFMDEPFNFTPDQSMRQLPVQAAASLHSRVQDSYGQKVNADFSFHGEFDSAGLPILKLERVGSIEPELAAAPAPVIGRGKLPKSAPVAPPPASAPPAESFDVGPFYVIPYLPQFAEQQDYSIAQGNDDRKALIEQMKAEGSRVFTSGIRTFKTYELAQQICRFQVRNPAGSVSGSLTGA